MIPPRILWLILVATASTLLSPASGVCEAAPDRPATATGKAFAQVDPGAGIRRFAEIRPGLARGGEPNEEGLRLLRDRGYRTIVSFLTSPAESAFVVQSGMQYVHIPMRSGPFSAQPPTDDQVRQFLAIVSDSSRYPVFMHCHAGKDRTGAMSAIYRMEVCGWTTDEALEEMKAFGFSGRYRRLFRFVEKYSGRGIAAATPGAATLAPR